MRDATLHGLIAAALAFVLVLAIGALPIGARPTRADATMTALIVFCVAAGHTAGIAAGSPLIGIAAGGIVGIALAAVGRIWLGRRA